MKHFSFYINILLIFSFLLTCIQMPDSCTAAGSASFCSGYSGNELVLLWDRNVDSATCQRLLSDFPSCTIVETLGNYMLISTSDTAHLHNLLSRFRTYPGIAAADPNYSLALSSEPVSLQPIDVNADEFSDLFMQNLNAGLELYHNTLIPMREVVIAVADTGIDVRHPLLSDFIWTNPEEIPDDGVDNDKNGYIDDIHGWDFYHDDATVCHYEISEDGETYRSLESDNDNHGTHVAGIIASVLRGGNLHSTEALPVPVKIMPLKIHGGEKASGSVANAIKAIKYAVMMNADICNISWGSSTITSSITTLEKTIRESDLLFITAAGNTGSDNDLTPVYPASFSFDHVISVTFVNSYGFLTTKSNYGATSVDIAAPGTDIHSTIVGDCAYMSGSSMAVPYVSGIAALLYSCYEGLSPASVRNCILQTVYPLPYQENASLPSSMFYAQDKLATPGVPDLYSALSSPELLLCDTDTPEIGVSLSYTTDFLRLNIDVTDTGCSGVRVLRYAKGTKTLRAFQRGTAGTAVNNNGLRLAKGGNYTFYASDYAGNETILHYRLIDDTTAPQIIPTLHSSPSGQLHRLIAELHEEESGIAAVYLAEGDYALEAFPLESAQQLTVDCNRINLYLTVPGVYTMYAEDTRGNTSSTSFTIPNDEPTDNKETILE